MSCGQNGVCVDKSATAEVGSRGGLEGHDEGSIASAGSYTSNDVGAVVIPVVRVVLGNGGRRDDGRSGKSVEEFGVHLEEAEESEARRLLS